MDEIPSDLTVVPVSTSTGAVETSSVSAALLPETCLVTVMLANNETGVVQPIREIRDAIREKQFHNTPCDSFSHTRDMYSLWYFPRLLQSTDYRLQSNHCID